MTREGRLVRRGLERSGFLVALLVVCSPACAGDAVEVDAPLPSPASGSGSGSGTRDEAPPEHHEEFLDACRRWCGAQEGLSEECVQGEAVSRGVRLGTAPFPEEPVKSYDLSCLDGCITLRGPNTQCWQQTAEALECLAQQAVFVCMDDGWTFFGCETAGTDPAVCDDAR